MKFKIKDRVAVYTMNGALPVRKTGFINVLNPEGLMHEIALDNGNWIYASTQQLRRLKPKQKPVAREFWIMYGNRLVPEIFTSEESAKTQSRKYDGSFIMRVREVLQNPTSNEVKK